MSSLRNPRMSLRTISVSIGLAAALVVLGFQIEYLVSHPGLFPSPDFALYWASGRLNASGSNPYDPKNLVPLELEANREQDQVFVMYSPPWMLALLMPFGILDHRVGRIAWLVFHFVVVLCSCDWIW